MNRECLKKIIVFAGTNEGRRLCEFLTNYQVPVTACVATEYGSLCLNDISGLNIRERRLSQQEIREMLVDYDYIIDATHPYARIITENIRMVAEELKKPYLRIIRPSSGENGMVACGNIESACEYLNRTKGNVLITTGSKELLAYTRIKDYEERLYVRVLPSLESLTACIQQGFELSHIICMQGPFSEELNIAMLRQINARYLVTKDTGKSGGYEEKITAAAKCNATAVVIGRPVKEEGLSLEQACEFLKSELGLQEDRGNYFPLFLNLQNRKIVIIGGGSVAARRAKTLLSFQAELKVVAREISKELEEFKDQIILYRKEYEEQDMIDAFLVVAATDDRAVNQQIYEAAKSRNILVNIADQKELSDFYFPAVFGDEDIIGGIISRSGENHKLVKKKAEIIREFLEGKG